MGELTKNPIKIIVIDAGAGTIRRKYCLAGGLPAGIISAMNSPDDKGAELAKYFGKNYSQILCLKNTLLQTIGDASARPRAEGGAEPPGRDFEFDISPESIAEMLTEDTKKTRPAVSLGHKLEQGYEVSSDIAVFPEDNLTELKEKIQVSTGIPTYRLHLFWFSPGISATSSQTNEEEQRNTAARDALVYTTCYEIRTETYYSPNILQHFHPPGSRSAHREDNHATSAEVFGIPIDDQLYQARDYVQVDSREIFRTVASCAAENNEFYIVDLAHELRASRERILAGMKDTQSMELLYYGYILPFFPQLMFECFIDYIKNETDLFIKYPELAKSTGALARQYQMEQTLATEAHADAVQASKLLRGTSSPNNQSSHREGRTILVAITQVIGYTMSDARVNIRNAFDLFATDLDVAEIRAYVVNNNNDYLLQKKHKAAGEIIFPNVATFKQGIVFNINTEAQPIFLAVSSSGRCEVKCNWHEDREIDFQASARLISKYVNPVITRINEMGVPVVGHKKLSTFRADNIVYRGLTTCAFWKQTLAQRHFADFREFLKKYSSARIMTEKPSKSRDANEYKFIKGIFEYDPDVLARVLLASKLGTIRNTYAHLSNSSVLQKWLQHYNGRKVSITHRISDVRFEVENIYESEFGVFLMYLCSMIYRFNRQFPTASATATQKLGKLKETDAELFNLKKHGSRKVYSRICQKQWQPTLYTRDEFAALPQTTKSKIVKYWNFTTKEPAYYSCDNKKYPFLSFIYGHPKNYCLPCCSKKDLSEGLRRTEIVRTCLETRKMPVEKSDKVAHHIAIYGKDIQQMRLGNLPNNYILNLFSRAAANKDGGAAAGKRKKNSKSDDESDESDESNDESDDESDGENEDEQEVALAGLKGQSPLIEPPNYYLLGVPQEIPGMVNMGALCAFAACLSISPEEFAATIRDEILKPQNAATFAAIAGGLAAGYFGTAQKMAANLVSLTSSSRHFVEYFEFWPDALAELVYIIFKIMPLYFIDKIGDGENIELYLPDFVRNEFLSRGNDYRFVLIWKRRNSFYPIIFANQQHYFSDGRATRIFAAGNQIITLIKTVVSGYINAKTINNRPDFRVIAEICAEKQIKIETLFINLHGLCYAVELGFPEKGDNMNASAGGKRIVFPIEPGQYTSGVARLSFEYPAHFGNAADLVSFAQIYNSHVQKYAPQEVNLSESEKPTGAQYGQIILQRLFTIGDKPRGFICGGVLYFVDDFPEGLRKENDGETIARRDGEDVAALAFDPVEINRDIIARTPGTSDESASYDKYVYQSYMYKLLTMEFANYLDIETNDEFRAKLAKFSSVELRERLSPEDYNKYAEALRAGGDPFEQRYSFDRISMSKLRDDPAGIVRDVCTKITELRAPDYSNFSFPNIYSPCAPDIPYCSRGRLLLDCTKEEFAEMLDILSAEMRDPLKSELILNKIWTGNVSRYFNFARRPSEVINIFVLRV